MQSDLIWEQTYVLASTHFIHWGLPLFFHVRLSSPSLFLPLPLSPPLIQLGGLGDRCELPHAAGPGGARPPNAFWCI